MIDMTDLVNEIANIGFTIFSVVIGVLIVNWLDRNVFSGHKRFKDKGDK